MNQLILHPATASQLNAATIKPAHGYLFVGDTGLGKTSSALDLANTLLGSSATQGDKARWILFIQPEDGKKLRLSQLERVKDFAYRSKPSGVNYKVIIIDGADLLTIEAANSLLNLLEEPPPLTVIVLVAQQRAMIPKTVLSRLQIVNFYAPTPSQLEGLISEYHISQASYKLAGRSPAKLITLSQEDQSVQSKLTADAQDFIGGSIIDRLVVLSTIASKIEASRLINVIIADIQNQAFSEQWVSRANSLIAAQAHLHHNGNFKFVLEKLAMEY